LSTPGTIPVAEALSLSGLITPTEGGIASRVLAKTGGGNVTLFAFDQGQGLSAHGAVRCAGDAARAEAGSLAPA